MIIMMRDLINKTWHNCIIELLQTDYYDIEAMIMIVQLPLLT